MLKYQNHRHYYLPITINPLEYGKLIFKIGNTFIVQINKTNIVIINQYETLNNVKLFSKGDFIFEYKDHKQGENQFIRSIDNKRFTFENHKLVSTDISVIRIILLTHKLNKKLLINSTTILYLYTLKWKI